MVYTKVETPFVAAFATIVDWLPIRTIFKELIVHLPVNSQSDLKLIAETVLIRSLAKNPRILESSIKQPSRRNLAQRNRSAQDYCAVYLLCHRINF